MPTRCPTAQPCTWRRARRSDRLLHGRNTGPIDREQAFNGGGIRMTDAAGLDAYPHLALLLRGRAASIDPELMIRMLIVGTAPAFELSPA